MIKKTWKKNSKQDTKHLKNGSSSSTVERGKINIETRRQAGLPESVVRDVPFGHVFCEEVEIGVPFVANDFPAREATNRDNLRNGGEWGV